MPYDLKTEKIQFAISILTDLLVLTILILPLFLSSELVEMILCLALFLLAIVSAALEYFLDVYKLIPVDLYETGLNVVI